MNQKSNRHFAITGGIGSGKSFVCQQLEARGIRVYDCDQAAKRLMRTDEKLQHNLCQLVGEELYKDHVLQKHILAKYLLTSEANKQAVNNIIHPAVAQDFLCSGYEWLESAILFESGFNKRVVFDTIVCVVAPRATRLQRIMQRDGISEERAAEWIDCQMSQEKMEQSSDFVINNDGQADLNRQLDQLLSFMNT